MTKLSLGVLLSVLSFASLASAQQVVVTEPVTPQAGKLEIGVIAGTGVSATAKWWLSDNSGIDLRLGSRDIDNGYFNVSADYSLNVIDFIPSNRNLSLPLYVGVGVLAGFDTSPPDDEFGTDDVSLGARIPVGVSANFSQVPIHLFAEIVPELTIVRPESNDATFDIGAGVGARFVF